ncbi:MAG: hypothetical protein P8X60_00170 [Robiginitalea sp.]|jgi:hypothetical protein
MKHWTKLFIGIGILLWAGCTDETTVYQQDEASGPFIIEKIAEPAGAVSFASAGVLKFFKQTQSLSTEEETAGDYPLTLVASITPPLREDGSLFTASHVDVDQDFAYVAYNTAGDVYEGAIDVVNISDPNNPVVSSRLVYRNADVNSVSYDSGFLYAVGSVDSETSSSAISNSFVARIPAFGGLLQTDGIQYGFQQGYNATDVVTRPDRILVSSGKEGGIVAYSKTDLAILSELFLTDARSLASTGAGVAVLDVGSGVRILESDLSESSLIPISADLGENSKKTIDIWDEWVIVAEGTNGAGIYEASTGTLVQNLPIPALPEGVDAAYRVTNAVSVNENAIFMANGGAGLSLAEREGSGATTMGVIELGGSVNYVTSQDDFAFAASGGDGLHIIKLNRPADSLDTRYLDLPQYEGKSRLIINKEESAAYRGEKRLELIQVEGSLMLGGSWTVYNDVTVASQGIFHISGSMAVGRNDGMKAIVVEPQAILRVSGNLTLYGDLILKDGATVEFLDPDSVIDIFGAVKREGETSILGTFRDVRGAFK